MRRNEGATSTVVDHSQDCWSVLAGTIACIWSFDICMSYVAYRSVDSYVPFYRSLVNVGSPDVVVGAP
jgi:hypothetical protein